MKTLTELSGILVRKAAAALVEVRTPSAVIAEVVPPSPAPVAEPAAESAPASEPGRVASETEAESDELRAALDAALATATGLSGDRLARLRDAVKVAGRDVENVRLVRVFAPDEPVPGATLLNGFQYLVDLAPATLRQDPTLPKKERFGRGGGRGGSGGAGGRKGSPSSGGFSMDLVKDDRKGQRSGRAKPGGHER
jgi:hypothetical protein